MPDLFQKSSAWLAQVQTAWCSQIVYYVRGTSSVPVSATIGRTVGAIDPQGTEVRLVEKSRDYLINVAELFIDDLPITPRPGDQIVEGDLDNGIAYDVMAIPPEDCWRWHDRYHQRVRIHTNENGTQLPIPQ